MIAATTPDGEDMSFDLLDLSSLETSCGVEECKDSRTMWPGKPAFTLHYRRKLFRGVPGGS